MTQRNPFVEYEAFATPAAIGFRHVFEIFQDTALEMIDLLESVREQVGAGLLATDTAGAEHCDLLVLLRIELARDEFLELTEALDLGIDRALKGSHRNFELIAGIDQHRIRCRDQIVPV